MKEKDSADQKFMKKALLEARNAFLRDDYPVGAVLVINNKIVGKSSNTLQTKQTWGHHAETQLLLANSEKIRAAKVKNKNTQIELYSTLEPCLMCFGCASLHRVDRIVYSCPDPMGGATSVSRKNLPNFYHRHWPGVVSGILKEESYSMLHEWMSKRDTEI